MVASELKAERAKHATELRALTAQMQDLRDTVGDLKSRLASNAKKEPAGNRGPLFSPADLKQFAKVMSAAVVSALLQSQNIGAARLTPTKKKASPTQKKMSPGAARSVSGAHFAKWSGAASRKKVNSPPKKKKGGSNDLCCLCGQKMGGETCQNPTCTAW